MLAQYLLTPSVRIATGMGTWRTIAHKKGKRREARKVTLKAKVKRMEKEGLKEALKVKDRAKEAETRERRKATVTKENVGGAGK